MASVVRPILIGDFGLSKVEFFPALADEAAEITFETVGHDVSFQTSDGARSESIIAEAAGPTKADCSIDDMSGTPGSVLQRDSREGSYLHDGQR